MCPDRAVVQGTRECVRKSCWRGKMMLSGAQVKEVGEGICLGQSREMRSKRKLAKNSSWRESFHAASGGERS